ncbi:MAG TPA: sigma-70 family RNA polymerase sigma factor [Ktedonobacteraceae bacterium]|nr:sigma-70 family RNA polymerase sigma factor [Ktedonobacteraceae bacterium]
MNGSSQQISREIVYQCIQEQSANLLKSIRFYVLKFGLARDATVPQVAAEILQETVIEAMAHANAYVPSKAPMAWLLGVALNMIRRKRVAQAKQSSHELPFSLLVSKQPETSDEDEWLGQQFFSPENELEHEVETRDQVASLLALVSQEDQQVIILAMQEDFKRTGLARRLGLQPNAAGMRLHRALARLREALEARSRSTEGGNTHA